MSNFASTSRYATTSTARIEAADGRTIVYLRRRVVPPPERFDLLVEHEVAAGERLDHLAAAYFGDPELFWRICDANGAIDPAELIEPGRQVRITLPEGIPGMRDA
jgi:hypothetical protein